MHFKISLRFLLFFLLLTQSTCFDVENNYYKQHRVRTRLPNFNNSGIVYGENGFPITLGLESENLMYVLLGIFSADIVIFVGLIIWAVKSKLCYLRKKKPENWELDLMVVPENWDLELLHVPEVQVPELPPDYHSGNRQPNNIGLPRGRNVVRQDIPNDRRNTTRKRNNRRPSLTRYRVRKTRHAPRENWDLDLMTVPENWDTELLHVPENWDLDLMNVPENWDAELLEVPENWDLELLEVPENWDLELLHVPENWDLELMYVPENLDTELLEVPEN